MRPQRLNISISEKQDREGAYTDCYVLGAHTRDDRCEVRAERGRARKKSRIHGPRWRACVFVQVLRVRKHAAFFRFVSFVLVLNARVFVSVRFAIYYIAFGSRRNVIMFLSLYLSNSSLLLLGTDDRSTPNKTGEP